jgi:hypothetical protein
MFSFHPQTRSAPHERDRPCPLPPARGLALAATPAAAADLPPPPPAGAPIEERLYLASASVSGDALRLLAARVDCVAFQRARIDARLDDGLLARGWNAEADRLWRLSEALSRFESAHIRPHIDAETQAAVLAAYGATSPDAPDRASRCAAFGDRFALSRVSG